MRAVRNTSECFNSFRYRLRAACSIACSALLVSAGLWVSGQNAKASASNQKQNQRSSAAAKQAESPNRSANSARRKAPPVLLPAAIYEGPPSGDDPNGRREWFLFQRTYPYDTFPAEGRRVAWEQALKEKAERERAANGKAQSRARLLATDSWRMIGPSPTKSAFMNNWGVTSGRINAVAISPASSQIILLGSSTGGIWRSTNGGNSFVPVSDSHVDLAVGAITFSKSSPSIVYAGMGDTRSVYIGSGVLKSIDAGRTWTRVSNSSLPSPGAIADIEVDPSNPNRVYAAQYSRLSDNRLFASGFHYSTDGGVNWTRSLQGLARDIQISPNNSRTIFAGMARVDQPEDMPAGVYKSTDSGATWSPVYTAPYDITRDVRVSISQSSPQKVYVYTGGLRSAGFEIRVEVSTNNGTSWTNLAAPGVDASQFGYNTYLHVDPSDSNRLYLGSRDIYKSLNGGASWTNLTTNYITNAQDLFIYNPTGSKTHPDQQSLAFSPSNPNTLFVTNDGGISRSNDGGSTYQSLNSSLTLSQFVSISMHPTDPNITYGGTQDNGNQRRSGTSGMWEEYFSGDGGRTVINPHDPTVLFPSFVRGNIFRFYQDGNFFDRQVSFNSTFGEPPSGARIAFYPPFTGNGVDPTLYFGSYRLFTSTDLGDTWSAPGGDRDLTKGINPQGADVLSAIGVARSNTRVIYTGSTQGRAMVSLDAGTTWTDITQGLPDRSITSITVDPNNEAIVYVTLSGYGAPHVFKTTDNGANWTNITGNLPDVPTNALQLHPVAPNTLYVGTDIGVFRSTSGGQRWDVFNNGIPPAVVTAFASHPSGVIQVATYGRGAYELVVNVIRPAISSAIFNGTKKLTITGTGFGSEPAVFINGADVTSRITSSSDTSIRIKGKPGVLGLRQGGNQVVVHGSDGVSSTAFTLSL